MVTFTRTVNSVEISFDDKEKHYISPSSSVLAREDDSYIVIADFVQGKSGTRRYKIDVEEINGRPSDLPVQVAEWLRDTYFAGQDYSGTGGGGTGDASAANQLTQIARADTTISDLNDFANKSGAALVTEEFDEKVIVYSDAENGVIDYIRYNLLGVEVARETFTYDGFGNVTNIS